MNNPIKPAKTACCNIICSLPFIIIFGMFAYGNPAKKLEPANDCFATYDSDLPYLPTNYLPLSPPKDYVNVTRRFDVLCKWGFWSGIIGIFFFAPIKLYYAKRTTEFNRLNSLEATKFESDKEGPLPFRALFWIFNLTHLIWICFIFAWRGDHQGYVCSGDFLPDSIRDVRNVGNLYDVNRGQFLYVVMIVGAVFIPLTCIFFTISAFMWRN